MNQKNNYQKQIEEVKLQIINDINKIIDEVIQEGDANYLELPVRIHILSSIGEELGDVIFGVRTDEAIINSMFSDSTPKLITLPIETLNNILEQIRLYEL
jgi:tetrahydromethanopterin S-methyltransferase subunit A